MSAHTPGPWRVGCFDIVLGPNNETVADCERTPFKERPAPPTLEDMANARLIAAAPELLDACRVALSVFKAQFPYEHGNPEVGSAWGALEDVIFKATNDPISTKYLSNL